jgi:hypothetical protein
VPDWLQLAKDVLSDRFRRVSVYGVPLNHGSEIKGVLFFVFGSVGRAKAVHMKAPPLLRSHIETENTQNGIKRST